MDRIRVGLVGISGYAGMEVARLLSRHKQMRLTMACSRAEAGKKLESYYPFLRNLPGSEVEISVYEPDRCAELCDLVFLAVPAGTAMKMAPELLNRGVKVVDFSADFRLEQKEVYTEWYKQEHRASQLLTSAVYGLPEINADKIRHAELIANPGCYPTASILALYPLLKEKLIKSQGIIIDAKSGASGAGRKASIPLLFCEISDNFRAYGIPNHRHTPEIEQELSKVSGTALQLVFTPHIVPMKRGILATIYTEPLEDLGSTEKLRDFLLEYWQPWPWIRVHPEGQLPETVNVRGSMFCDLGLVYDKRTKRLIVLSAIDNLCRGASGQAIANANLMLGLDLDEGLKDLSPLP